MVIVYISDLKAKKDTLHQKIDDYEMSHVNLNNILNEINSYWNSPRAQNLFNNMYEIKKEIDSNIVYLKNVYNIYNKIEMRYSKFGWNSLYVDLNNKEAIIDSIEENFNNLKMLKVTCIKVRHDYPNAEYIINQLNEEITLLNNLKKSIKNDLDYIEETEKLISKDCHNIIFKDISSLNLEV